MARQPIARMGDGLSHGGAITGGASKSNCEGAAIARVGDPVHCNIHGAQTITSGSAGFNVEGAAAARRGDMVSCGATITGGASNSNAS